MRNQCWIGLVGTAAVAAMAVMATAGAAGDEHEAKLALDQVPAAVKAAIRAEGGKVEDVERQTEKGKTIFEADVIKDGKEIELRIAEDGTVLSRKIEGDANEKQEEEEADEDDGREEREHEAEGDDEEEEEGGDDEAEDGQHEERGGGEAQMEARAAAAGAEALPLAKVTMVEAVETALAAVAGGKAYMVQLKTEDHQPRYEVQIIVGDKRMEVAVDGVTRKVLEVEAKGNPKTTTRADAWRAEFKVDTANLGPTGRNPYWNLEPGYRFHYAGGKETLIISVLDETRVVDGVTTRVVEERESKNGQLVEVSRNFFAIDKATLDVYYFGEEVDIYRDGKVVKHEGAWLSGQKAAHFGLMVPGKPVKGDRFYQEIAPGEALDRAEITRLDEKLVTPAGTFEHCLHMKETTPLERDVSHKWWAPGVGLVKDDGLVLIKVEKPGQ